MTVSSTLPSYMYVTMSSYFACVLTLTVLVSEYPEINYSLLTVQYC